MNDEVPEYVRVADRKIESIKLAIETHEKELDKLYIELNSNKEVSDGYWVKQQMQEYLNV
jgi:coenzyme F420-reducing hydrogenase alpha subunit